LLRLTYNGNVGIGTDNPAVKFHVNGTNASIGVIGTPKADWYTTSFNGLQVADGLTLWGRAGDAHMSGNYYVKDVSGVAKDSYINTGYAHDLWFDIGSGDLLYRNAASGSANAQITSFPTRFIIKNNGDVGIGTSSPAQLLHVNGTLHVGISGVNANDVTGTLNIGNTGTYYMTQIKAINVTANPSILNTRMGFFTLSGTGETVADSTEKMSILAGSGNVGIGTISPGSKLTVNGSLSKSSGSFRIDHPLEAKSTTHDLVHSFVEAPQADNIYRGKVDLVNGSAIVNIDTVAGMTEGTFVALNREVQCFTTNESNWDAVKGSVSGNILTIESQNSESTATISWLVIGERQDSHMYDTEWTDDDGKVIVEPLKTNEE